MTHRRNLEATFLDLEKPSALAEWFGTRLGKAGRGLSTPRCAATANDALTAYLMTVAGIMSAMWTCGTVYQGAPSADAETIPTGRNEKDIWLLAAHR